MKINSKLTQTVIRISSFHYVNTSAYFEITSVNFDAQ